MKPETQDDRPAAIQIKVLFFGGEAWKDALVTGWTSNGHPIAKWAGGELIPTPGEWRPQ